jgi:hypothetical protein
LVALVFAISPGPMEVGYSRAKFIWREEIQWIHVRIKSMCSTMQGVLNRCP